MKARTRVLLLVALAALCALLLWEPSREPHAVELPEAPLVAANTRRPPPGAAGAPSPEAPLSAPNCAAHAVQACHEGDVWWFDGCGEPEEPAESCHGRACIGDHCALDPRCGQVSEYGVCEGATAVACLGNRVVRIDCDAKGQRCVDTREGARCMARDPARGCDARDRPRCVGDRLRACSDGFWSEIDCAARRASCLSDGDGARCGPSAAPSPEPRAPGLESCRVGDADQDGKLDDGAECEAAQLVAFVPEGARLTELEIRMQRELEALNRALAPLRFEWARTVQVPAAYRELAPDRIDRAAAQLSQQESRAAVARAQAAGAAPADQPAGLSFYIPVLFVERLKVEPPKSGMSTLPNSQCGGVRIADAPSPPYGIVVLADQRTQETLSHELGHYLGLCHTHEELDRLAASPPELPPCKRTGDGICDTPEDRGPSQCYDRADCDYFCPASSARPDSANLMSYYMTCRHAFTSEQVAEAAHGLELRRGWFRCLEPSDCPCDPALENTCPAAMSCQPSASDAQPWTCTLEGPGLPGTGCRGSNQCARGTICVGGEGRATGQCVRLCVSDMDCAATDQAEPAAQCMPSGAGFRLCADDLRASFE